MVFHPEHKINDAIRRSVKQVLDEERVHLTKILTVIFPVVREYS